MNTKGSLYSLGILMGISIPTISQNLSQKVDIKWGNEIKASRKTTLSDIVGYDENNFYAIRIEYKGFIGPSENLTIDSYDSNANQIQSIDLELGDGRNEKDYEEIVHLDNKLYLFSSIQDKKSKKNMLFVQSIDKTSLLPNTEQKKIAEIDYTGNSRRNSGGYDFQISRDKSKLLIYYNLPYEKGEKEKFGFKVFDKSLNLLWTKNITLPYNDELFEVERYVVDNKGDVYLLGMVFKDKRRKKRNGEPNYQYSILSYKNNGAKEDEYPVNLQGSFLTDMNIQIADNQDIICAGFYSEKGTFSIKGSYFLSIDSQTKEIKSKSFKEFAIEVMLESLSEKKQKKLEKKIEKGKEVELYDYDLDNLVLRDDGGALLVAEQYYISTYTTTTTVNGVTTTTTTFVYHYNDIIVINMNPQGQIEWTKTIPKRQITSNDRGFYSSYVMSVVKDKLYFVFNDNPKNLIEKITDSKKVYRYSGQKESVVALVEIDGKGNLTKDMLFKSADAEVIVRPKVCEQVSDNELIIFGQRKKTQRFARLTFK